MNTVRILLVAGILGIIALISFLLIKGSDSAVSDPESETGGVVTLPDSSGTDSRYDTEVVYGETPEGYIVSELPVYDTVSYVAAPNPSPAFAAVEEAIYEDYFWLMSCQGANETARAIIFTAEPSEDTGTYEAAERAVRIWEPNIVADIGAELYPGITQQQLSEVTAEFRTNDADSRMAVFTVGGRTMEIYYGWVLNFIIFASTEDCLAATINDTYAPHGH